MAQFGYPPHFAVGIGLTPLVCTILYAIPRTAVIGALLLIGYLGGAVASPVWPLWVMVWLAAEVGMTSEPRGLAIRLRIG